MDHSTASITAIAQPDPISTRVLLPAFLALCTGALLLLGCNAAKADTIATGPSDVRHLVDDTENWNVKKAQVLEVSQDYYTCLSEPSSRDCTVTQVWWELADPGLYTDPNAGGSCTFFRWFPEDGSELGENAQGVRRDNRSPADERPDYPEILGQDDRPSNGLSGLTWRHILNFSIASRNNDPFWTTENQAAATEETERRRARYTNVWIIWGKQSGCAVPNIIAAFDHESPEALTVAFDASASAGGGTELTNYRWDFGDGTTAESDEPTASHRYAKGGDYQVTLTVTNATGETDSVTNEIEVVGERVIVAGFSVEVRGRKALFENTSVHLQNLSLTYIWDFGDGNTSTASNPHHIFDEAGQYSVRLTAMDPDGATDDASGTVEAQAVLFVDIAPAEGLKEVDKDFETAVVVENYLSSDVTDLRLAFAPAAGRLDTQRGPSPAVLRTLALNQSMTVRYLLRAQRSGDADISAEVTANLVEGPAVRGEQQVTVAIAPELEIELRVAKGALLRAGEAVDFELMVTNNDDRTVTELNAETLSILPNEVFSYLSGPLSESGVDLRTSSISLAPGATTIIRWRMRAEQRGAAELRAILSGAIPELSGRFSASDATTVAVDSAALAYDELRLAPNRPVPGTFSFIRGKVTNVGSVDVSNVNFEVQGLPKVEALEALIDRGGPQIAPRFETLTVGETREFIIPLGMPTDVGELYTYSVRLRMFGVAEIDTAQVEVSATQILGGGLDRSSYWIDILSQVRSQLVNGFISVIDQVDSWAEDSTLGGVAVGAGEGVLGALQKMGDSELAVGAFLKRTVTDTEELTKEGWAIVNMIEEYRASTSAKKMLIDFADVRDDLTIGAVASFSDWMTEVSDAAKTGDSREISRLLSEPGTELATGYGAEQMAGKLFTRYVSGRLARLLPKKNKKKGTAAPDENADATTLKTYYDELDKEWDAIPPGVPLRGTAALKAGVEGDDLGFMIETAKKHNLTFYVRPRPAEAAKWARAGFNAKPLPVKLKSVNDIDCKWLGYDCELKGLVVMREPKDPYPALKKALDNGEFTGTDRQLYQIVERYHNKKAEFASLDETLAKMNSIKTRTVRDRWGNVIAKEQYQGIVIRRYGKEVTTTVSIDDAGRLIFDYNGKPVYSDIDLLSVAKRDGTPLSPALHRKILEETGYGFDGQHHATVETSDFGNQRIAANTAAEYLPEHTRNGDGGGLLIISPDATTKGFVESFELISEAGLESLEGKSGYELYRQIVPNVTYSGAQIR